MTYAWWKLIFWLSFSLENDHRLQFRSISQAGKDNCEAGLLVASGADCDRFLSSCGDCSRQWHVKANRCLVHIANVDKFIVIVFLLAVEHEAMEVDNLLF